MSIFQFLSIVPTSAFELFFVVNRLMGKSAFQRAAKRYEELEFGVEESRE